MTKVRAPDTIDGVRVRVPDSIAAIWLRTPTDIAPTTESITIDFTGAPTGASWTLRDTGGVVATGTASTGSVQYPFETYTITWEDTAYGHLPPSPDTEGPSPLVLGTPLTFGPP